MERDRAQVAVETIEQQQNRPPYIIRAHHIVKLSKLLKSGNSVNDFPNTYAGYLEKKRTSRRISRHYQSFLNDVLGTTLEQADKFRRYEKEFLEEFLQLPSDYPVKIVDGQKDKICQGCAIGKHCSERPMLSWLGTGDEVAIKDFRKGAKKLSLEDDVKVVPEIVTYSNTKPRKVETILTTARTAKEVLVLPRSFWSIFF